MTSQWRDSLAGARMQVDQRFNDRVLASEFTNQEWGLVMTAVEFDIRDPGEPDSAELVADTENVKHVIPELENLPRGMGEQGGQRGQRDGGGILGSIRNILGGDGGGRGSDQQKLEAATALVEEYAGELETYLKEQGRWEAICERAAGADDGDS